VLFPKRVWPGLQDGSVHLAFRRWRRPGVRPGGRYRTPAGVLEVDAVDVVEPDAISEADARAAGFAGRTELLAFLDAHPDGTLYRIAFHHAGADPRLALREQDELTPQEWSALRRRLERMDRASRSGPWTAETLRLIAASPAVLAADLAASVGRERAPFKRDVRKLKELGLTESLRSGYRLSPRGRRALELLDAETAAPA
jgi:hypothetical protein